MDGSGSMTHTSTTDRSINSGNISTSNITSSQQHQQEEQPSLHAGEANGNVDIAVADGGMVPPGPTLPTAEAEADEEDTPIATVSTKPPISISNSNSNSSSSVLTMNETSSSGQQQQQQQKQQQEPLFPDDIDDDEVILNRFDTVTLDVDVASQQQLVSSEQPPLSSTFSSNPNFRYTEPVATIVDIPGLLPRDGPNQTISQQQFQQSQQQQQQQQQSQQYTPPRQQQYKSATVSSPWQYDDTAEQCKLCSVKFKPVIENKHHCRYCGYIFCHNCSSKRCMIPPSRIVVIPQGGKKVTSQQHNLSTNNHISFSPDPDPDGMLTYYSTTTTNNNHTNSGQQHEQLLYGKGLEQRIQLARQPLRVCDVCYVQLQPVQHELRTTNSNSVRYNYIDPAAAQRMFNSPIAFTLGHEIRKAAYTLNNLLPVPKRRVGAVLSYNDMYYSNNGTSKNMETIQQCRDGCFNNMPPNLADVDGIRIPAQLLERCKGVAVLTVLKTGFGFAGGEVGTGLVVAKIQRQPEDTSNYNNHPIRWSAPSAIGIAGMSWGALIGAQVSDHVFVLMTDTAVEMMFQTNNNQNTNGAVQLGVDIGIAAGPVGRSVEGDVTFAPNKAPAPIYAYSQSKGLYAGVSLDGKILVTRHDVNENFYGYPVSTQEILSGAIPTPPAAQPLYEALTRCHVYATNAEILSSTRSTGSTTTIPGATSIGLSQQQHFLSPALNNPYEDDENWTLRHEYGDVGL